MTAALGYAPKLVAWEPPIVLIGEHNPHSANPRHALYDLPVHAAGHRLRTLVFGVERTTYSRFHRANLLGVEAATPREAQALVAWVPTGHFVLLGRTAHEAFGLGGGDPFRLAEAYGRPALLLPHPSGRNRLWAEKGAFTRAAELLRAFRPDVPWGETGD